MDNKNIKSGWYAFYYCYIWYRRNLRHILEILIMMQAVYAQILGVTV